MSVLGLVLVGCQEGGSGDASSDLPFVPEPGESLTVSVKSGDGFSCALLTSATVDQVYCEGSNATLGLNSVGTFTLVAESTNSIDRLEVWDDTLCLTAQVATRPFSGLSGEATYCIGEASLGVNYTGYPLVYSGPAYSDPTHGSADLTFGLAPFAGGDISMAVMADEGGTWLVMMDGSGTVTTQDYTCTVNEAGTEVDCGSFSVVLQ